MISVIVPFRTDHAEREMAYDWCMKRYIHAFGDVTEFVVCGDGSTEGPFNKAKALNDGVERSHGDVLMFADADSAIDLRWAKLATDYVVETGGWALTSIVYYLSRSQTDVLLAQDPTAEIDVAEPDECDYVGTTSVGGHLMLPREAWERVNGADERFTDWGPEDGAFAMAMSTLWRHPVRLAGSLVHLWHPAGPPDRPWSPGAGELMQRYNAAVGDTRKMLDVVRGNR